MLGSCSKDGGDGNENVKKAIDLITKATKFSARALHFLVHLFAVTALDFSFFFLFLNLGAVSKTSTAGNFTYIWHLRRVGIIATTFKQTRIHFNSDVFAVVAVVVAKVPNKISAQPHTLIMYTFCDSYSIENW